MFAGEENPVEVSSPAADLLRAGPNHNVASCCPARRDVKFQDECGVATGFVAAERLVGGVRRGRTLAAALQHRLPMTWRWPLSCLVMPRAHTIRVLHHLIRVHDSVVSALWHSSLTVPCTQGAAPTHDREQDEKVLDARWERPCRLAFVPQRVQCV